MTFFWTPDLGDFFFNGLEISTYAHLAILCGVVSLFAILYEGIKVTLLQRHRTLNSNNNNNFF